MRGTNYGDCIQSWSCLNETWFTCLNFFGELLVAFVTPVIGGTIVQSYGYRLLFITALVMALSALFVTLRFIPNTQVEKTDFA